MAYLVYGVRFIRLCTWCMGHGSMYRRSRHIGSGCSGTPGHTIMRVSNPSPNVQLVLVLDALKEHSRERA